MNKIDTELKDCYILEPTRFGDARGYFSAPFIDEEYRKLGFQGLKQVSRSKSAKGVLRGMHFQKGTTPKQKLSKQCRVRSLMSWLTYAKTLRATENGLQSC